MSTTTAARRDTPAPTLMTKPRFDSSIVFGLSAAAALLLGHVPLVTIYFQRLMLFEHYEFVPLLAIGVSVLMFLRLREIPSDALLTGIRSGIPLGRLMIGCGLLAVSSLFCSPLAAILSLIICLGMFLNSFAGIHWKTLLPVWALLFLLVRPPLHLDLVLITRLQLETSRVASTVLESMGVMHLMEGNVLVVPQRRFLVEEACSGIHSVFALLTAAAFYAVWMRTPWLRGLLLMVSAIFWACFMNLVRIAATIIAFENLQIDLGEGWAHSATGLVTFFVAVIFLMFTDQMLRFFLDPIDQQSVRSWDAEGNPLVRGWNGTKSSRRSKTQRADKRPVTMPSQGWSAIAATFIVAGVSAIAIFWQIGSLQAETEAVDPPTVMASLTQKSLPDQLGSWGQMDFTVQRRKKDPILSDVSKIWTYRGPSHSAIVSIDYPFRGWHQLSGCYEAQGWKIDSYRSVPLTSTTADARRMSQVLMHRATGERGLLLFVVMDDRGQLLHDPAIESFWVQISRRVIVRLQRPLAIRFPELAPGFTVTTQLQMLIMTEGDPIPSSITDEAHMHFNTLHADVSGMLNTEMNLVSQGGPS